MSVDDGLSNSACRAMLRSELDVDYYENKYHTPESMKKKKKDSSMIHMGMMKMIRTISQYQ